MFYNIIGDILFHSDDSNDEVAKERTLAIFEDVVAAEGFEEDLDLTMDRNRIVINNPV